MGITEYVEAKDRAKRILQEAQVGNNLARGVFWTAHIVAGRYGGLTSFERGMYVGKLIFCESELGAEPWVVMSVENQINMLQRAGY